MRQRTEKSVPNRRRVGERLTVAMPSRGTASILERLKPEEAASVLGRVLVAHPELRDEAELHARSLLCGVTHEAIADAVETAVKACDLDDFGARAGRHERRYVQPTEAAWELLEETVDPFIVDMRRRITLGLEDEALAICKGVVLGLYRADRAKRGDVLEWAPDFPAESAAEAVREWLTTRRPQKPARVGRRAFPRDFVDQCVPEWGDLWGRHSALEAKT